MQYYFLHILGGGSFPSLPPPTLMANRIQQQGHRNDRTTLNIAFCWNPNIAEQRGRQGLGGGNGGDDSPPKEEFAVLRSVLQEAAGSQRLRERESH